MDKKWKAATGRGDIENVRWLLEHGTDINSKDEHDQTALMNAAHAGQVELIRLLIEAGADVNIPFANLILAGAVTGLICAATYHYLQLAFKDDFSLFFMGMCGASIFFCFRIYPSLRNDELTSPFETLERVLTEYDIEEFFTYKRELMEEIRTHPNFEVWSCSLPDDVQSVVSFMLRGKHDLELMKRADILPAEDLKAYPFLVTLLRRNPDVVDFMITRALEEMKYSIKSHLPRA